jgi:hypothetical protein
MAPLAPQVNPHTAGRLSSIAPLIAILLVDTYSQNARGDTCMAGSRSPKYPNFSLRTAVKQAEKIFQADRRNVLDRFVAVKHMGYSGLSGPADKSIATLVQYGLLERVGKGEVRVSQTAVDILHPDTPRQKAEALKKAAYSPPIFKAVKERFPDGVSSDALASYLVRENFLDRAISPITRAYSDTLSFLEQSGASDSGGDATQGATESASLDDEDDEMDFVEPDDAVRPGKAVTPKQGESQTPTLAHLRMGPGMQQAAFPLAEGTVYLTFPENLTSDGYAELSEYLGIFLKRSERAKRLAEAQEDFKEPPSH